MSINMYDCSVPYLVRALRNLSGILSKGEAFARGNGIEEQALTGCRLYPNMIALARQVQIASDTTKGAGARLAELEPPSYEDTEVTFDELQARITRTIEFLEGLTPEQINGSEDREIVLKAGDKEFRFKGLDYLHGFVLPNLNFHCTTAYNILRHVGVKLGKLDYLGEI